MFALISHLFSARRANGLYSTINSTRYIVLPGAAQFLEGPHTTAEIFNFKTILTYEIKYEIWTDKISWQFLLVEMMHNTI